MFSDKLFQIALAVSLAAHGIVLLQNPGLGLFSGKDQVRRNIEVSYIKEKKAPPADKAGPKPIASRKEPLIKLPSRIMVQKAAPPPFIDTSMLSVTRDNMPVPARGIGERGPVMDKPVLSKPDVIAVKKRITLPPVGLEKINNPSYISYYQVVREKIRRAAYQNYTRTEQGEVYLSFIISSDGYLSDVRLVEERSAGNQYLRDTAMKSIKNASPFPNFPKELDYPQLSFNVVISFEVE